MKKKLSIFSFLLILGVGTIVAQTTVPLPPHSNSYSGLTRGYWFTAPSDFVINTLNVPTDASSDPQSVAVIKLAAPPALWPVTTSTYTTEAIFQNVPGNTPITVNVQVLAGEVIGILGSRGNAVNSYGASPFNTDILGMPITISRLGMQDNLATNWPHPIFAESGGSIGRVEMAVSATGDIPTMGEWGLIILTLLTLTLGAVTVRRRQMALAGIGEASVSLDSLPFERSSFFRMLGFVLGAALLTFVAAISLGYELTSADIPGTLLAAPIAAYLLHLVMGRKND